MPLLNEADALYLGALVSAAYLDPALGTAMTPDAPDLRITGDVRWTAKLRDDSVEGPTSRYVVMQAYSNDRAYGALATYTTNLYGAIGWPSGSTSPQISLIPGARTLYGLTPPGSDVYVGAEVVGVNPDSDVATLLLNGLTSTDGKTWTRLGGTKTPQPANSLSRDAAVGLYIGTACLGRIYWVQCERLDAAGNPTELIWRFDANEHPGGGATSYVDPRGRTWTLSAAAALVPRVAPAVDAVYLGTDQVWPYVAPKPTTLQTTAGAGGYVRSSSPPVIPTDIVMRCRVGVPPKSSDNGYLAGRATSSTATGWTHRHTWYSSNQGTYNYRTGSTYVPAQYVVGLDATWPTYELAVVIHHDDAAGTQTSYFRRFPTDPWTPAPAGTYTGAIPLPPSTGSYLWIGSWYQTSSPWKGTLKWLEVVPGTTPDSTEAPLFRFDCDEIPDFAATAWTDPRGRDWIASTLDIFVPDPDAIAA